MARSVLVALTVLVPVLGCAHRPPVTLPLTPLQQEPDAPLVIVAAGFPPTQEYRGPSLRGASGAAAGVGAGLLTGVAGGLGCNALNAFQGCLAFFATPFLLIHGAILGATGGGVPAAQVAAETAAFERVTRERPVQWELADQVFLQEAWGPTRHVTYRPMDGSPTAEAAPAYTDLHADGVAYVLEVAAVALTLDRETFGENNWPWSSDAPDRTSIQLDARARLVRTQDGAELQREQVRQLGHVLGAWSLDDATLLRAALTRVYAAAAAQIVCRFLTGASCPLPTAPPVPQPGE